jgi:hypothetical protein
VYTGAAQAQQQGPKVLVKGDKLIAYEQPFDRLIQGLAVAAHAGQANSHRAALSR